MAQSRHGRIITFYSYKGGTGRSMALANVAWILASNGKRVLVIDWDLEAPGLHRYFHPFLQDKDMTDSAGLIDFVVDFAAGALNPANAESANGAWFIPYTNLLRYAVSLKSKAVPNAKTPDFVGAGRQDEGYAVRVNSFNWQQFYEKFGGGVFLEAVKQRLRQEYDYVLIDSRTGVSDTSGICTVQMPDDLVVCFTLNAQSMEGAVAAGASALSQRKNEKGESTLRVWPVPTRVELGEKTKLDLARRFAQSRLDQFLEHMPPSQRKQYWGKIETLYQPFYAYEEVLAVFADTRGQSNSLLSSMETITAYLTDQSVRTLGPMREDQRQEVVGIYSPGHQAPSKDYTSSAHPHDVFISYTHDSPDHMNRILALSNQLRASGVDCQIDQYQESPREGWPLWCENQIDAAEFVLVACTETYLRRLKGEEKPATGRGATWEGHVITRELFDLQGSNKKFIPITFAHADASTVPATLRAATRYDLPDAYEALYRRLTHEPLVTAPPLGEVSLPSLPRKQDFLPPWNVPHARNPFFTGRGQILTELNTALKKTRTAALVGIGGVGKTQTAVEFAYLHRDDYKAVFWASAESRETLVSSFAAIAGHLNLPEAAATEQQAAASATKRWLESNTGWLLILDNADDLAIAREFLPQPSKGHLLLTTRAQATKSIAERVEIQQMDLEEAVLFLLRRADVTASEAERDLAKQISTELGCLPLALDQAGAFISETPSSLAEYLDLYRQQGSKLLALRGDLAKDHPSVAGAFALAFEEVAAISPAGADLIRICAFLASDSIPEEIFTTAAGELGDHLSTAASNPLEFTQVIKEATRFSLIDRTPAKKTLDIHRLVQAVVKDTMNEPQQRAWAERAVRALNLAFPRVEFANWPTCDRMLPHAQACADRIAQFQFEFPEAARLLNQTGFYLYQRARYAEAEPLYHRSVAIREKALGPDHPAIAQSLNNLAELYRIQGKYAEAEALSRRSLAIQENSLGTDHPDEALSLNNLAQLYRVQGKYAEAEALSRRSLSIQEKSLGLDHADVARSLNNLAMLYQDQGKYAEAEPLSRRSLSIQEKSFGPDHPDIGISLNNLALLYQAQSKWAEAEPLYHRSLTILEKALGPDHPHVAISLYSLAELNKAQGKYAEAERLYRRSLAIFEKALGSDHPSVAATLENLADLLTKTNHTAEAQALTARAKKIRGAQQNSYPAT